MGIGEQYQLVHSGDSQIIFPSVFLFAWQVMAAGDQSACAAQARSLSGSKHIGLCLLLKVLDKGFGKQLVL